MSESQDRPTGFFGWTRRIDDAIFAAEQSIVALALIAITAVIFVDVIARRITAPDSKVGELIARIGGIEELETRDWIGDHVAPWVTVVVALFLIGFAVYSGRRFARRRARVEVPAPLGPELGYSVVTAVAVIAGAWGFAYVFEQLESWMVYAGVFSLASIGYVGYLARTKPERWGLRAAIGAVVGGLLVWFSLRYVPEGYTWSKKVSLMLVLWVGMLSASICVYAGKHIRIEAASKLVPEKAKRWVSALSGLGGAAFCALMAYLGYRYVFALEANDDEYMMEAFRLGGTRYVYSFEGMIGRGGVLEGTEIPDWIGILSAPIGFGIATLRFVGFSVSSVLGGDYGAPAPEEGMDEARAATDAAPIPDVKGAGEGAEEEEEEEEPKSEGSDGDAEARSDDGAESDEDEPDEEGSEPGSDLAEPEEEE